MKNILTVLSLLVISTGVVNAQPFNGPQNHHKMPAPQHKIAPMPKPQPIVYQVPVQIPTYSNNYGNSPYVNFSLGNVDVTVGI